MVWEFECNFVIIIPEWHPSVSYFHPCQRCNKLYVKATVLFLRCRGWCTYTWCILSIPQRM